MRRTAPEVRQHFFPAWAAAARALETRLLFMWLNARSTEIVVMRGLSPLCRGLPLRPDSIRTVERSSYTKRSACNCRANYLSYAEAVWAQAFAPRCGLHRRGRDSERSKTLVRLSASFLLLSIALDMLHAKAVSMQLEQKQTKKTRRRPTSDRPGTRAEPRSPNGELARNSAADRFPLSA